MGTVIDDQQRGNFPRHQRWDRRRRAALLHQYRDLHAHGLSQRQAAHALDVLRTTLQAWRTWQERLDAGPQVVEVFESVPGLAFLPRLVLAFPVVCVAIGAWGIRLVCLLSDGMRVGECPRQRHAQSHAQALVSRVIASNAPSQAVPTTSASGTPDAGMWCLRAQPGPTLVSKS